MKAKKLQISRLKMRRRRKIIDDLNERVGLPKPVNDAEYNRLWEIWRRSAP